MDDEVGDDAAVIGEHARAVGVKDADDADIDFVLAVVVEEERLGAALAFVVAGAAANGVDVAPVVLGLRMHGRVAIDFRGGGLEDAGADALGQAEAVDGPHDGGLQRLDRVVLIVGRRGGAGEVVNLVHLGLERLDHIVPDQFETGMAEKVLDVGFSSGEEVVQAEDFVPGCDEPLAKMGAKESGSAGDEDAHGFWVCDFMFLMS